MEMNIWCLCFFRVVKSIEFYGWIYHNEDDDDCDVCRFVNIYAAIFENSLNKNKWLIIHRKMNERTYTHRRFYRSQVSPHSAERLCVHLKTLKRSSQREMRRRTVCLFHIAFVVCAVRTQHTQLYTYSRVCMGDRDTHTHMHRASDIRAVDMRSGCVCVCCTLLADVSQRRHKPISTEFFILNLLFSNAYAYMGN